MSWGNRLLLVFIAFAGLMSYMVYRCYMSPVQLADKEYYKDELVYQNVIDRTNQANALSKAVSLNKEADKIIVEFPPEMKDQALDGNIVFYCASDERKDRSIRLNNISGGKMEIDKKMLVPGYYQVKISWHAGNTDYYAEQAFAIL